MSQDTWVPLVDYRRNGVSEVTIHGAVSWVSGRKLIHAWGGNVLCYGRSMMKPLLDPPSKASPSTVPVKETVT